MIKNLLLVLSCAAIVGCAGTARRTEQFAAMPQPVLRIPAGEQDRAELQRAAAPALTKAPAAQAVIHVEGVLPTLSAYQQADQAKQDWPLIAMLASYYAVSGEGPYLKRYELYLSAWLNAYRISGNPIDETDLSRWMLAFRASGGALSAATQVKMRLFACELAERYLQRQPMQKNSTTNNWQSHRVKLAVMGAFICADPELIASAQVLFEDQIRDNLLPTGEAKDFFERDALHYVVYSLEPLLEASLFAKLYGKDIFRQTGPNGQSLSRSLAWLAPYALGNLQHMEFVHSTVPFDAERALAGVAGYSGPFDPRKTQYVYWLAAQLEPAPASGWNDVSRQVELPSAAKRLLWSAQ